MINWNDSKIFFNDVSLYRVKWWIFHGRKLSNVRNLLRQAFVIYLYLSFIMILTEAFTPRFATSYFPLTYPCHVTCRSMTAVFTSMKCYRIIEALNIGSQVYSFFCWFFSCLVIERFSKLFFFPKRLLVDKFCDIMWHLNGVTQSYHPFDNMTLFNELFIDENCHSH